MKLAVQIFGHLRTYGVCHRSLYKNILSRYSCDIFIHTWSDVNHYNQYWNKEVVKQINSHNIVDDIKKIYAPKKLLIEDQKQEKIGKAKKLINKNINIDSIKSMYHSMTSVNNLRLSYEEETSTKYDFVIMLRPDLYFRKPFIIEDYFKDIDPHIIEETVFTAGLPLGSLYSSFKSIEAADVFFFARPYLINKIYSVENIAVSLAEEIVVTTPSIEYLLAKSIKNAGYTMILINYIYKKDFSIIRPFNIKDLRFSNIKKIRRGLFSVRINKNRIHIVILGLCVRRFLRITFHIGEGYCINICLGNGYINVM